MSAKVLAYGEVLFDVFGDKEQIGGAPFNFAAHMALLGAQTALKSAVGADARGERVRDYLARYGVEDRLLSTVAFPTGICRVTLDEAKVPQYELVRDAAWDNIPETEAGGPYDLFYFGSLSQRSPVSAQTLKALLGRVQAAHCLFDCNVRLPFAGEEALRLGLEHCTVCKVSREEAPMLHRFGLCGPYDDAERAAWCAALAERYGLQLVLLTLDRDGAAVYEAASGTLTERPARKVPVVSTVGAGDSFAAAFMTAFLAGRPLGEALDAAQELASRIIQIPGALPER